MSGTEASGFGRIFNVLFLCTHNSARSVIAECILNRLGQGKFRGYSAGSMPRGSVNPYALDLLRNQKYDVSSLRSKSWDEFGAPGAPHRTSSSRSAMTRRMRCVPYGRGGP